MSTAVTKHWSFLPPIQFHTQFHDVTSWLSLGIQQCLKKHHFQPMTAVNELPSMNPFGPAVSWRMVHGSGWVISLRVQAPLIQLAPFRLSFFCLQFQTLSAVGLPGTGYCNDKDRSRLRLAGKGSMPFLAGSISFYIAAR